MNNPSTNNTSKESKRTYWSNHINQWEESKLSQPAYCAQAEIQYTTFLYWKKIFAKASETKSKRFVPLKMTSAKENVSKVISCIQIKMLAGHIISIPTNLGMEAIAKLINLLGDAHA